MSLFDDGPTRIGTTTTVLITGGTGSFGQAFTHYLLANRLCHRIIIFSRDERKQAQMAERISFPYVDYFLGDVRDYDRLRWAFEAGVDLVIHAAALKRVDAAEYNPFETVKTNIEGTSNLIRAARYARVKKVIALSTDKAVNPINLYGSTKLTAEKLFIAGNIGARTAISCVRWGNVFGSRGSVVEKIEAWRKAEKVQITDPKMTRFWITLPDVCRFIHRVERVMQGGEIFIPHLPAAGIARMMKVLVPKATQIEFGIRAGEKIHESLLAKGEANRTGWLSQIGAYLVEPVNPQWAWRDPWPVFQSMSIDPQLEYRSDIWPTRLSDEEIVSWYEEWRAENGEYDFSSSEPNPRWSSERVDGGFRGLDLQSEPSPD